MTFLFFTIINVLFVSFVGMKTEKKKINDEQKYMNDVLYRRIITLIHYLNKML